MNSMLCSMLLLAVVATAQTFPDFDVRSFDGTDRQDGKGRANSHLIRWAPPHDLDCYSEGMVNPRRITNAVGRMSDDLDHNQRHLSNMLWQWGQFIDHDFALTTHNNGAPANIVIPLDDPDDVMVQSNCPMIPLIRSDIDPDLPTREQMNAITAFLDASMVYGSDETRANALRSFADGKLKSTIQPEGELLPFNTEGLENAGGSSNPNLFTAGDVRANEQVGLTAIHTLFVREHNRLADRIKAVGYTNADDEKIYQLARLLVMAEIQIITYNEFLPALLGRDRAPKLEDYQFQSSVNPMLSNEFSTAIFRFGHSMLPKQLSIPSMAPDQTDDWLSLRRAFFNMTFIISEPENIDRILQGLVTTDAEEIDCRIVEDVRSFLFSHDGVATFCLDLAVLNIQRGRDHQIPPYNNVRQALGLPAKSDFDQITSDVGLQDGLRRVYGSVDHIDPWIGALAEDHLPGASVGELLTVGMATQFRNLRDGDPFFFKRSDPIYNLPEMPDILDLENVSLGFILEANTNIVGLEYDKVFATENLDETGLAPTAQPVDRGTIPPATPAPSSTPGTPEPTPGPTRDGRNDPGPVGEPECHKWILSGERRFSTGAKTV